LGWTVGFASLLVKLGVNPNNLASPNRLNQIVEADDPNHIPEAKDLPWEKGKPPGEGWTWKGKGTPESGQGNWVNDKTGQKMHPDFDHPAPKGPHWGLQQPTGEKIDIFPDGSIVPGK
jgi:hypothetical protein